jgi:pyrrolidone-carboxylate peptidase
MINLLAVAFEPPPWAASSAAHQALAVFEQEQWSPKGAALRMIVAPCQWWGAAEAIGLAARGMDAILLLGAQRGEMHVSVTTRALNRANPRLADASGLLWPGSVLAPRAKEVLESNLDSSALIEAFRSGGVSSLAGVADAYVYNRVLYALLTRESDLPVALARLPLSVESARAERKSALYNRLEIVESLRAALTWMAADIASQRLDDLPLAS